MISVFIFKSSGLSSSLSQGHFVVFLGKILYTHSTDLSSPRCINGIQNIDGTLIPTADMTKFK